VVARSMAHLFVLAALKWSPGQWRILVLMFQAITTSGKSEKINTN